MLHFTKERGKLIAVLQLAKQLVWWNASLTLQRFEGIVDSEIKTLNPH